MLSLVLTSLVGSPAEAKPKKGKDKVSYGTTSWVAGTSGYSIKGKVRGAQEAQGPAPGQVGRRLAHDRQGEDQEERASSRSPGSLDWYGAHKLRVVAPKTRRDRAKVFKTKKFKIGVPWMPRGSSSSYGRMNYKGINFQWNPCKTIKYRINPGYAGEGVIAFTQEAVELLEQATGFKTKYVGTTTSVPIARQQFQKGTDMVIAWSHQDDYPELVQAVGVGGPGDLKAARRKSNNKVVLDIKRPGVTMNMAYAPTYPFTFDDAATRPMGLVLIHELGPRLRPRALRGQHPGHAPGRPSAVGDGLPRDVRGRRPRRPPRPGCPGRLPEALPQPGRYSALDLNAIPDFMRE